MASLSDEQWRTVLELANAAAEMPQGIRAEFIRSRSSTPDIAREAIALVAAFETPVEPSDLSGTQISHFLLLSRLGSGGMGDVYSAQDLELGRTVAVKLLSPHALALDETQDRFIREARTASALNHPNIVTVHEIVRSDFRIAIVMERVEGVSLRELATQAQPVEQVIGYGQQIADALAAAHAAGVVHRDIKPENLMLRPDNRIKVLDFGLARTFGGLHETRNSAQGIPAGTWRYMSPEQFKGMLLTGKSDVFALGIIFYELLTGRYPFSGGSPYEILQSVVTREVDPPSVWNPSIPPQLDSVVEAMLAKDPAQRPTAESVCRSFRELEIAGHSEAPASKPDRRRWAAIAIGLPIVLGLAIWVFLHNRRPWTFEQVTTLVTENRATAAAISSDGQFLAYANNDGVFLRDSKTGDSIPLRAPADFVVDRLAWLSDATRIVASGFASSTHQPAIWSLPIAGGAARELRKEARYATPSPDGRRIAFLASDISSIWVMDQDGSNAREVLSAPAEDTFLSVFWTPKGRHLLCQRRHYSGQQDLGFVMMDRYYERSLESVDLATGRIIATIPDVWIDSAASLSGDRVLFLRLARPGFDFENQLWQVRVDPDSGRFHGALEKVADLLQGDTGRLYQMSATSDGQEVAVLRFHGQNAVFTADLHSDPVRFTNTKRLTLDERSSYPHAWTGDSKSVIFESDRNGSWDLFKQQVDQRVPELIVGTPGRADVLPQLSPDGKWVLYASGPQDRMSDYDAMRVPVNGGTPEKIPANGKLDELRCGLRPDSRCALRTTIDRNYYVFSQLDPVTGIGRELARTAWLPSLTWDWGLSPDGRFVAIPNHDWRSATIRLIDLDASADPRPGREISLSDLSNLAGLAWAVDGKGWFISVMTTVGRRLLYVDLNGAKTSLGDVQGWVVPSPDGRRVAYLNNIAASNAWLISFR